MKSSVITIKIYKDEESEKVCAELVSEICPVIGVGSCSSMAIGNLLQEIGIAYSGGGEGTEIAEEFINLVS